MFGTENKNENKLENKLEDNWKDLADNNGKKNDGKSSENSASKPSDTGQDFAERQARGSIAEYKKIIDAKLEKFDEKTSAIIQNRPNNQGMFSALKSAIASDPKIKRAETEAKKLTRDEKDWRSVAITEILDTHALTRANIIRQLTPPPGPETTEKLMDELKASEKECLEQIDKILNEANISIIKNINTNPIELEREKTALKQELQKQFDADEKALRKKMDDLAEKERNWIAANMVRTTKKRNEQNIITRNVWASYHYVGRGGLEQMYQDNQRVGTDIDEKSLVINPSNDPDDVFKVGSVSSFMLGSAATTTYIPTADGKSIAVDWLKPDPDSGIGAKPCARGVLRSKRQLADLKARGGEEFELAFAADVQRFYNLFVPFCEVKDGKGKVIKKADGKFIKGGNPGTKGKYIDFDSLGRGANSEPLDSYYGDVLSVVVRMLPGVELQGYTPTDEQKKESERLAGQQLQSLHQIYKADKPDTLETVFKRSDDRRASDTEAFGAATVADQLTVFRKSSPPQQANIWLNAKLTDEQKIELLNRLSTKEIKDFISFGLFKRGELTGDKSRQQEVAWILNQLSATGFQDTWKALPPFARPPEVLCQLKSSESIKWALAYESDPKMRARYLIALQESPAHKEFVQKYLESRGDHKAALVAHIAQKDPKAAAKIAVDEYQKIKKQMLQYILNEYPTATIWQQMDLMSNAFCISGFQANAKQLTGFYQTLRVSDERAGNFAASKDISARDLAAMCVVLNIGSTSLQPLPTAVSPTHLADMLRAMVKTTQNLQEQNQLRQKNAAVVSLLLTVGFRELGNALKKELLRQKAVDATSIEKARDFFFYSTQEENGQRLHERMAHARRIYRSLITGRNNDLAKACLDALSPYQLTTFFQSDEVRDDRGQPLVGAPFTREERLAAFATLSPTQQSQVSILMDKPLPDADRRVAQEVQRKTTAEGLFGDGTALSSAAKIESIIKLSEQYNKAFTVARQVGDGSRNNIDNELKKQALIADDVVEGRREVSANVNHAIKNAVSRRHLDSAFDALRNFDDSRNGVPTVVAGRAAARAILAPYNRGSRTAEEIFKAADTDARDKMKNAVDGSSGDNDRRKAARIFEAIRALANDPDKDGTLEPLLKLWDADQAEPQLFTLTEMMNKQFLLLNQNERETVLLQISNPGLRNRLFNIGMIRKDGRDFTIMQDDSVQDAKTPQEVVNNIKTLSNSSTALVMTNAINHLIATKLTAVTADEAREVARKVIDPYDVFGSGKILGLDSVVQASDFPGTMKTFLLTDPCPLDQIGKNIFLVAKAAVEKELKANRVTTEEARNFIQDKILSLKFATEQLQMLAKTNPRVAIEIFARLAPDIQDQVFDVLPSTVREIVAGSLNQPRKEAIMIAPAYFDGKVEAKYSSSSDISPDQMYQQTMVLQSTLNDPGKSAEDKINEAISLFKKIPMTDSKEAKRNVPDLTGRDQKYKGIKRVHNAQLGQRFAAGTSLVTNTLNKDPALLQQLTPDLFKHLSHTPERMHLLQHMLWNNTKGNEELAAKLVADVIVGIVAEEKPSNARQWKALLTKGDEGNAIMDFLQDYDKANPDANFCINVVCQIPLTPDGFGKSAQEKMFEALTPDDKIAVLNQMLSQPPQRQRAMDLFTNNISNEEKKAMMSNSTLPENCRAAALWTSSSAPLRRMGMV